MEPEKKKVGRPRQIMTEDEKIQKRREYQNEYYKLKPRPNKTPTPGKKGRPRKYPDLDFDDKKAYKKQYNKDWYEAHKPEKKESTKKIGRPLKDQALFDKVGAEEYNRIKCMEHYNKRKEKMRLDLEKNNINISIDEQKSDQ